MVTSTQPVGPSHHRNELGLRLSAVSFRPRVTDSPHQNREQHPTNRSTCGDKNVPKDAHAELVSCVTFLHGGGAKLEVMTLFRQSRR